MKTPAFAYEGDENMIKELRQRCIRAVYALWGMYERPLSLSEIYNHVTENMIGDSSWKWYLPLKRTVDRRINETADQKYWPGETPCISVHAGYYIPNPLSFTGRARTLLDALVAKPLPMSALR